MQCVRATANLSLRQMLGNAWKQLLNRLLLIEASPRGEGSVSSGLARRFAQAVAVRDPRLRIDRLDLWRETLPDFAGDALAAKYARLAAREHSAAQESAWRGIEALVARLAGAGRVVIATPMWNFGIPYRLKHWLDLVTQPGLTFSFDPAAGYKALLPTRPVAVVLASAGDYAQGPSWGRPDLASPYLQAALGFIGLRDPTIVLAGPTAGDPARVAQARQAAERVLDRLAKAF